MFRRLFNGVLESALTNPAEVLQCPHPFNKSETAHFGWLTNVSPCFPVSSSNIKIITEPSQFYSTILQYCQEASYRVTLVSLYLGTGDLETKIVNALLTNKQFQNRKLLINILFDYTRGSRNQHNSRTILQPLLQQNDANCTLSLYHTPLLRGLLKHYMPNRYNELIGLQHMKLYVFDDTLIISGANLSNDYFTNRQDRYFVIKNKKLSDFYCGLVDRVQKFSLKVSKNDEVSFDSSWNCSPYEGSKEEFIQKAGDLVENYLNESVAEQNNHMVQGFGEFCYFYSLSLQNLLEYIFI